MLFTSDAGKINTRRYLRFDVFGENIFSSNLSRCLLYMLNVIEVIFVCNICQHVKKLHVHKSAVSEDSDTFLSAESAAVNLKCFLCNFDLCLRDVELEGSANTDDPFYFPQELWLSMTDVSSMGGSSGTRTNGSL